ncbi:TssQ family T6SS-associated lipoprotein [Pseudomonadota bacterium AL_CKDN230030165-1A_HGKHYDSX7]
MPVTIFQRPAARLGVLLLCAALSGCTAIRGAAPEAPATSEALAALDQARDSYGGGRYGEVIRLVATSDDIAGAPRAVRVEAFKLQAFSYCVSNYRQLCEDAFVRILALQPDFALAPNEAGHPNWGPVFRTAQQRVR